MSNPMPTSRITSHTEDELQSLLNAAELLLEGLISVTQIELFAQIKVDAIHPGILPGRVRFIEQVEHRENLRARPDRFTDEPVQWSGEERNVASDLQALD